MRVKFGFVVIALVLAAGAIVPTARAEQLEKWNWVCHDRGNGRFVLLIVGAAAVPAHEAHGDVSYPYDPLAPPPCP